MSLLDKILLHTKYNSDKYVESWRRSEGDNNAIGKYSITIDNVVGHIVDDKFLLSVENNEKPVDVVFTMWTLNVETGNSKYDYGNTITVSFSGEDKLKEASSYAKDLGGKLRAGDNSLIMDGSPVVIPAKYSSLCEICTIEAIDYSYLKLNNFPEGEKRLDKMLSVEKNDKGDIIVHFLKSKNSQEEKEMLQEWVKNPVRELLVNRARFPVVPEIKEEIISETFIDVEATNADKQNKAAGVRLSVLGEDLSFTAPSPDKQLNVHLSSHRPDGIKVEAVVPVTYLESEEIIKPVGYLESKKDGRSLFIGIVKDKSYSEHHSSFTITTADGKEISNLWKGKTAVGRPIPVKELDMKTVFALMKNPYDKKFRDLMPKVYMEVSAEEAKGVKYATNDASTKGFVVFSNLNDDFSAKLYCDVLDVRKDGSMEMLFPAMQEVKVKTVEGKSTVPVTGKEDVLWLLEKNRENNRVLAKENILARGKNNNREQKNDNERSM